jgi:adenylate cyclase
VTDGLAEVRETLARLGASDEELARATKDGTLPLLAVERLILPEAAVHDLEAVTERTGVDAATVALLWRTLGYPVPRAGEPAFTDADVAILGELGRLIESNVATADLLVQMSRVIGSAMARVASAQVDVISARVSGSPQRGAVAGMEVTDEQIVTSAGALLPIVPGVLEATWRRHLLAAVRRRLSLVETGQGPVGVVGFADQVGYTAISQQVDDDELAAIVDQFEQLAFDAVTEYGGRVVKMIGDEVMFTVESPVAAAEIALALAEGTRGTDDLSELRVGMAFGPLLERESDLYGPTVNLASRITAVAFPGTILVGESLRDQLAGRPEYRLRTMRPRHVKDLGRVPLWVLRRAAAGEPRYAARRRALRDTVKAHVEPAP